MDPSVGSVTRYTGALAHIYIRGIEQTFGVRKYVLPHILVQVAHQGINRPHLYVLVEPNVGVFLVH